MDVLRKFIEWNCILKGSTSSFSWKFGIKILAKLKIFKLDIYQHVTTVKIFSVKDYPNRERFKGFLKWF